jgi:catechol 2,3-dioxygenase-like lactoylglutathione lyase family enzyme
MPSFAFTKMFVRDLDQEVAFYQDVIGLKIVMRMTVGEDDSIADEVVMSADGTSSSTPSLALLQYRHRPAFASTPLSVPRQKRGGWRAP